MEESSQAVQFEQFISEAKKHYLSCQYRIKSVHEKASEAINDALLCGSALIEAKKLVGDGRWRQSLELHWPEIGYETAKRWIRLASGSHVTDLSGCKTLRQAYLACGIISESPQATTSAQSSTLTIEAVERWAGWFDRRKDKAAEVINSLPPKEKAKIMEALKPMVEIYQTISQDSAETLIHEV